jgi:hypothetical protein
MGTLAQETQMFMAGAPAALEEKLRRLQARDLVMRNVLALSAGVKRTLYWDLWHDTSDPHELMALLFGKIKLMDYRDGALTEYHPHAEAFRRMSDHLRGVQQVVRLEVAGRPSLQLFEVRRRDRSPVHVVWDDRDVFTGEDQPPVAFQRAWPHPAAEATDALGRRPPVRVLDGRLELEVADTPVFIEPLR